MSEPTSSLLGAARVLYVIAALNVVVGLLAEALDVELLRAMGVGIWSVAEGLLFAAAGWFTARGSRTALVLGMLLFAGDGIVIVVDAVQAGGVPPVGGIVFRAFLLLALGKALFASDDDDDGRKGARGSRATRAATTPLVDAAVARKTAALADAARQATVASERERGQARGSGVSDVSLRSGVDRAAGALRFVAAKCELGEGGMRVTGKQLAVREVPFADVREIVARLLPPDPPWDGKLMLDIVVAGATEPVRVFPTTVVNYAALPGGAAPGAQENMRRLARFLVEQHGGVALDDATAAFVRDGKPAARFAGLSKVAEYDARFG